MKKLLVTLFLLLPALAFADDVSDAVLNVSGSKMSMTTVLFDQNADVVYVGAVDNCDAVSIMWTRVRIDNYRVCKGNVIPRNDVSPAWDSSNSQGVFSSVVNNAISFGQAQQKDSNGYLISARALNSVSANCKNIEVIVSFDGDLVDRDVHQTCGH